MDEYISREEVVRYLKGYSEKELNKGGNFGMITSSVLDKAERAISEMPSADVKPVKHGRWVEEHTNRIQWLPNEHEGYNAQDTSLTERRCSNCTLWSVDFTSRIIMNFCPMCGARMDGDSE